jgi:hypothetical protein
MAKKVLDRGDVRIGIEELCRHNAELRIMPSSMGKSSSKPDCYKRVLQGGT